jgi:hypothetical protein
VSLIIHLQFSDCVSFLFLLVSFDSQARISPRGEINRAVHG